MSKGRAPLTAQQVRTKLFDKHGDRYQFPNIENEYKSCISKITAICDIHGEFTASYNDMANSGSGCTKCGKLSAAAIFKFTPEQVRERLYKVHGDRYKFPYVEMEYVNAFSKLTGFCDIHGAFQLSFTLLTHQACGCQKCGNERVALSKINVPGHYNLADYKRHHLRIPSTDLPVEGPHGELQVHCKMCGKIMTPTYNQVMHRIECISSLGRGESNFYCSDKCKSECTVFNKKNDNHLINKISDYESEVKHARDCQLETKRILRQAQFDKYGYNYCEKCGREVENPDLHHTIEVAKDPRGAITIAGQMLVCGDPCHNELTASCR